jgi:hypothetical protein
MPALWQRSFQRGIPSSHAKEIKQNAVPGVDIPITERISMYFVRRLIPE